MGLVEAVSLGKHHKYRAVYPSKIESIARRRMVEAENLARELSSFSAVGREQDFEIIQGARAIQIYEIARINSVPAGTTQYLLGGASEHFLRIMGERYEYEYAPLAKEKGIFSKYLGCEDELVFARRIDDEQKHFEFRVLPGLSKSVVNAAISGDSFSFYTFVNPPILYVIKSQVVADNYRKFFEVLWNFGKAPEKF